MKKLVIFDLDGTLINSVEDLGNACNNALSQMGYPTHTPEAYNIMVGNGISKLIERALPEDARRQRVIEAMRTRFTEYYNEHLWDKSLPYRGIPELLMELQNHGVKVAVASNKYQEATTRIIEHFFPNISWASIMGQRDMIPLKPDPSIIFNVLLEAPTPKAEVLFVGDSGIDMETAYRACIDRIGVTWGYRTRGELASARADYLVSEPEELLDFIL